MPDDRIGTGLVLRPGAAVFAAVLASVLVASPCFAQGSGTIGSGTIASGTIADGRAIALSQCSECHQVRTEDRKPRADVPGFPDIANLPSTTALSIRVFLQSEHGRMPSYQLARDQIDNVVAFILSLKR